MTESELPNPRGEADLVADAVALTAPDRTKVAETFFLAHPGNGAGRFGLGRAVLDFQAWEVASGRLEAIEGSSWWRGVNGLMVLDMSATLRGTARDSTPVRPWEAFAASEKPGQAALWDAHQRSLHAALRACGSLLDEEPLAERSFAEIVIEVVDLTAVANSASDSDGLSQLTEKFYPKAYPISPGALPSLRRMREQTRHGLRASNGETISNVGMNSTRWN